jgi:signal transduction histidine kinase
MTPLEIDRYLWLSANRPFSSHASRVSNAQNADSGFKLAMKLIKPRKKCYPRCMTNRRAATNPTGGDVGTCRYPDCTRPRRPSDATPGRPSLYCEQADPADGPIHNAANAWKERQRRRRGTSAGDGKAAAEAGRPVSMAKLTLEDQLGQLPARIDGLIGSLREIRDNVTITRDREAIAAEVDQVHADALAKTAEADRLRGLAERRARQAEQDKDEADAAASAAQAAAEESAQAAEAAREQLRAAQARVVEVENARAAEQEAARQALAAAAAEVSALRAKLVQVRSDAHAEQSRLLDQARSEREALRAQYAEQLAQIQRHADERAAALNQALELARDTAQAYHAQLGGQPSAPDSPTPTRPARPKRHRP